MQLLRSLPGRKGMTWEEEDWVDDLAADDFQRLRSELSKTEFAI